MSVYASDCEYYVNVIGERVAEEEQRCCACREVIPVGHTYRAAYHETYNDDDEEETECLHQCLRCAKIHDHLEQLMRAEKQGRCPDWTLDCGHEYEEEWNREPPDEVAQLAFLTAEEAQAQLRTKAEP